MIAGGGKVGRFITRDLLDRKHEITLIERLPDQCERLVAETDVLVLEGDATDLRCLRQARLDRAEVFVATTGADEDNLVACQLARSAYDVPRSIARVNTPKNLEIFEKLGIEGVSSTRLISQLLEQEFTVGDLTHLTTLRGGRVNIVEVKIPEPGDIPAVGRRVRDLNLPRETVLVALFRGERTVIPRGETELQPGDDVVALTTPEREPELRTILLGDR